MTDKVLARNDSRAPWLGFAEPVRIADEQTAGCEPNRRVAPPLRRALRVCTRGLRGH